MSKTTRRIGSRKNEHRVLKGFIHVQASFNNTIMTITDVHGQVLSWSSIGSCGFKGTRKGTPFTTHTAVENVIRTLMDRGMQRVEVMISGPSPGRDTTLGTIRISGILLSFVRDITPMPHNGCRPPQKICV